MESYVILGAGVVGLTTALELKERYPSSKITVVAKFFPGNQSIEYTSPWAGANWVSTATDSGRQEEWDAVTYRKFAQISAKQPESGVHQMELNILVEEWKIWYEDLIGGLRPVPKDELPEGACFGIDLSAFVIDVPIYLTWLQKEAVKRGIKVQQAAFTDIHDLFKSFPGAKAYFNCTGLGSPSLKGVEDKLMYPSRGQTTLIENPKPPLTKIYIRLPKRVHNYTIYIFPRGPNGGVILGGCRLDNDWNGEVDMDLAEEMKRNACALVPELGRPEDLKVIRHQVGLRPSRKGGPRVEKTTLDGEVLIHNYGAGGAGYQSSWGTAKEAVDLLLQQRTNKL